jgi:hypothetical protein
MSAVDLAGRHLYRWPSSPRHRKPMLLMRLARTWQARHASHKSYRRPTGRNLRADNPRPLV